MLFLVHVLYDPNTRYLCPRGLQTHPNKAPTCTILCRLDLGVHILVHELQGSVGYDR
jgi:hypothetical protein